MRKWTPGRGDTDNMEAAIHSHMYSNSVRYKATGSEGFDRAPLEAACEILQCTGATSAMIFMD